MKTFAVFAILLIVATTTTGVLWYLAASTPEPEWFEQQTINSADDIKIKARVAERDASIMDNRLRQYFKKNNIEFHDEGLIHYIYNVNTRDHEAARTLVALNSHKSRITPNYSQWPNVPNKPELTKVDTYQIKIKLRGIHHQPNIVRGALASLIISIILLFIVLITGTTALDKRVKKSGGI